MRVLAIDHYTIRCHPDDLPALHDFYNTVLGLTSGPRPDFDFPGHWLYADAAPLVHLAGLGSARQALTADTGQLDHISFRAEGLRATRERLDGRGIVYEECPVPGMPLYQVFLRDPTGLKIELTFNASEVATANT